MFPVFEDFLAHRESIMVIGLGYIGWPLAMLLAQKYQVMGYDANPRRMQELQDNFDRTGEMNSDALARSQVKLVSSPKELAQSRLVIVAVPTPVDIHHVPDLEPLKEAVSLVGENMPEGTLIVFESTVYPGVTEEICAPLLQKKSGLVHGSSFKVAYSPERVSPGDAQHSLPTTTKIVSGEDQASLLLLSQIYGSIIEAGVCPAPNIRSAEAAKIIENTQRDLNIALVNELSIIFHSLNIDLRQVLDLAGSKWNFHRYTPGLVGGHCIGVDPYYLAYKCEELNYHPQLILAARRINNLMGKFIAGQAVKCLAALSKPLNKTRVLILGFTYKENVRDIRNTRVAELHQELKEYAVNSYIFDPLAWPAEAQSEYGLTLCDDIRDGAPYDLIIGAVRHEALASLEPAFLRSISSEHPVFMDIKAFYHRSQAEQAGFKYWSL